jgi:hypothetical protein
VIHLPSNRKEVCIPKSPLQPTTEIPQFFNIDSPSHTLFFHFSGVRSTTAENVTTLLIPNFIMQREHSAQVAQLQYIVIPSTFNQY